MTEIQKQQIIKALQDIKGGFVSSENESELTMFGLISRYNATGQNSELIGGVWAKENGFDLPE